MEILRYNDIDLAITTRELAKYLKKKINLARLKIVVIIVYSVKEVVEVLSLVLLEELWKLL